MQFMKIDIVFFVVITLWSQLSCTSFASCSSAIYSFGDSLADTGNFLESIKSDGSKPEFDNLPYGETYFRKPTGRFSDGRLIVDYIANASGLPLLNPYLRNRTSKYKCGINFAVAGATALDPNFFTSKNIGPLGTSFSLDTQIQWFLSQRQKFCATYRGRACSKHFANALFLMGEIGGNDYNYPFFQQRSMQEVQTFVPLVVDKIINALQTLITVGGARKILVQNNLPIGCSAAYLTKYATGLGEPLDKMGCMPRFNIFAQKANNLLRARVSKLQAQHPDVKVVFADYYNAALRILQFPQSFGLQRNILPACCGAGGPYNYNNSRLCGDGGAVSCANPQQYFNWDGIHLTDAAYGKIANLFLDGTFTSPPLNTLCSSFGDSLADTGNLLASIISNGYKPEFDNLPYGETYFGKPTGRFSDGRLIVDYIANASGLPLLDPYLRNRTSTFKGGVNFAVAGATALDPDFFASKNITLLGTPFSLDTQIQWFLSLRPKICATYRGRACNKHFANALFLMGEIGGNDYYYPFLQQRPMQEVQTFVPLVVDKIINALQTLITVGGASKILVQNSLPIGCSVAYLTQYATGLGEPLDKMGCMPRFNTFAQKGNDLLRTRVAELQAQHPDVKVVFADYYNAALRILRFPQSFGLQRNVLLACCGAGGPYNYNNSQQCGQVGAVSCANPQQYFNWDGLHLTDAAYGKIANLFLDGTFTSPPLNTLCSMQ